MKKTQHVIITILSLFILIFFAETNWADICTGSYTINEVDTSGDIAALSGCTGVSGNLNIRDTALTDLSGLEGLTSVGGFVYIGNNNSLTSLSGLDNLTSIGLSFVIDNNALTSLNGLENLTSVGGYLTIEFNPDLTNLSALSNLTSMNGNLTIDTNNALTSLSGLEGLTRVYTLRIEQNTNLTSLNGLENLTKTDGALNITGNDALTSLNGLNNITEVDGWLSIYENDVLTSLSALSNLTYIGDDLSIYDNPSLASLVGLENLTTLPGYLYIDNCDSLTSLNGLENLTSIGILEIVYNDSLTSLNGLENLTSVGGNLWIEFNLTLTNLCALYNANVAGNTLAISGNPLLSMNTALALETQLINNGFSGTSDILDNFGTVDVFCDHDYDGVYEHIDNCPDTCNSDQLDADNDTIGDVCDDTPGCGDCGQDPCELPCATLQTSSTMTDHNWKQVRLSYSTASPVVIAGPPTDNGPAPGVVRLKNVADTSFAVRFQEWQYIDDGYHNPENVPYLVISEGRHVMDDGSIWEAGTFTTSGTGSWTSKSFTGSFASPPALFLTAQTYNGEQPITVRARNVTSTEFEAALFEEEALMDGHVEETVGYLAIYRSTNSGTVDIDGTDVSYYLQEISVTHQFVSVLGSSIKMEEEQSFDDEVSHVNPETVNVLKLGDQIFAQDVTTNGSDPAAIRRQAP